MIYIYFVLGILCLILSGMWFGSICTDYVDKIKISLTQYFMFVVTFTTGLFQLLSISKFIML